MGRGLKHYVLEHLPQVLKRDLNHVSGEIEDEDGDWATEFIIADPLPPRHHLPQQGGAVLAQACASHPHRLFPNDPDPHLLFPTEEDASFICNVCSQYLPLHMLGPELRCSCLCCRQCLKAHVESMLSQKQCHDIQSLELEEMLPPMRCPSCSCEAAISFSSIKLLAPEVCKVLEEKASQIFLKTAAYIHCPSCDIVIEKVAGDIPPGVALSGVPEFDRTAPFTELDDNGRPLSRIALFDKYQNYYRCSLCKQGFCGLCMSLPYHLGYTCEEFKEFENAKRCVYCNTPILWRDAPELQASSMTVKQLQNQLDKEGVDASWCVEKRELLNVWDLVASVCDSNNCKRQLQHACTRKLECGHQCGGIRGERACMPCLEDVCRKNTAVLNGRWALPSADDLCTICMVEPIRTCPSIQLKCGHVFHFECAKKKVKEGFPGPEITFGFLKCPQCSELMGHESLENVSRKPLELLSLVKDKASKRARMEKSNSSMNSEELEAFGLNRYNYYLCCKCQIPYYGGNRDCGGGRLDAVGDGNLHNPLELVCGGCSAAANAKMVCSKGHGNKYIEYKCKYCCSVATFFCFGRTHFCSNCHLTRPDGNPGYVPPACRGPQHCPLGVAHAPNGEECCLGCSMCRILSQ